MNFLGFSKLCEQRGLTARQCNPIHWQILGGLHIVNFYPTKGTIYVCGLTERETRQARPEEAVNVAMGVRELTRKQKKLERCRYAAIKHTLLARHPFCHWCEKPLEKRTATADHLTPLSRGGSNEAWNIVLACHKCNETRGDSTGAPQ